jgi:hypothetical protein
MKPDADLIMLPPNRERTAEMYGYLPADLATEARRDARIWRAIAIATTLTLVAFALIGCDSAPAKLEARVADADPWCAALELGLDACPLDEDTANGTSIAQACGDVALAAVGADPGDALAHVLLDCAGLYPANTCAPAMAACEIGPELGEAAAP